MAEGCYVVGVACFTREDHLLSWDFCSGRCRDLPAGVWFEGESLKYDGRFGVLVSDEDF